jgi:hypothetical protein
MAALQEDTQTFGHFEKKIPTRCEYLTIGFSPSYEPLKKRWENNGLSADFIADYFRTFYISRREDSGEGPDEFEVENLCNTVKYIANELLENAMKFQDQSTSYTAKVFFYLRADKLVFRVTNAIRSEQIATLQNYIQTLLNEDPQELYLAAMRASSKAEYSGRSGLGLLSMLCDYSAKLGWQFAMADLEDEEEGSNKPFMTVTTMVTLDT